MKHLHQILDEELVRFGQSYIEIVETGSIRGTGDTSEIGDGYSTLYFARRCIEWGGHLVSIDLNVATARMVLAEREPRNNVTLVENHSIAALARQLALWDAGHIDVAFLDSANDAQLVLHEFMICEQLVRNGGLVLIDDVHLPHHVVGENQQRAAKGDLVWGYAEKAGYKVRVHERDGYAGYKCGVLAIDIDPPTPKR